MYAVRRLDDGTILRETNSIESALGFAFGWNHHWSRRGVPDSIFVEVVDLILLAGETADREPATLSEDNPKGGESG